MKILNAKTDDVAAALKSRGMRRDKDTERIVEDIIDDVRRRGDAALLDNARRFDAPGLEQIHATKEDWPDAIGELTEAGREALQLVHANVCLFHETQRDILFESMGSVLPSSRLPGKPQLPCHGWMCKFAGDVPRTGVVGQRYIPLHTVGVYVPGGQAAYPSSVIMNAAPASVAGVPNIVVATPARPDGTLSPAVRAALNLCEVSDAVMVGGAAAIAAFALGTETVPRVDKLVGPGNRFVNEAKRQLWGQVGLDGYAGPSEVCVFADNDAKASFVAADLLTQVEHAPDNAGFLITLSEEKLFQILEEVERQLVDAPRADILRAALAGDSLAIVARDTSEAVDLINLIAPEHLTIAAFEPDQLMAYIRNAGCILLGDWTPESGADYGIGPSHTLPTGGAARWQSPLNVLDFVKVQSMAGLTYYDLEPLIPVIEAMGELEGLPAHARGATIRRRAT